MNNHPTNMTRKHLLLLILLRTPTNRTRRMRRSLNTPRPRPPQNSLALLLDTFLLPLLLPLLLRPSLPSRLPRLCQSSLPLILRHNIHNRILAPQIRTPLTQRQNILSVFPPKEEWPRGLAPPVTLFLATEFTLE